VSGQTWRDVDVYISGLLIGADPALDSTLEQTAAAGIPAIAVSPAQGKLLHLLARSIGARSILEIGTLGGYSTIWLARALAPGGRLVTLEADERNARVARENVELRVGRALETLPQLAAHSAEEFDLVFIDADKVNTPEYFTWALELTHPGSLIIADNVIRDGTVADAESTDPAAQGSRRLHELLAVEPRVSATTIQTVGAKGYDGFALALVLDR
jgi:predicted O-methyltransferase YrrM